MKILWPIAPNLITTIKLILGKEKYPNLFSTSPSGLKWIRIVDSSFSRPDGILYSDFISFSNGNRSSFIHNLTDGNTIQRSGTNSLYFCYVAPNSFFTNATTPIRMNNGDMARLNKDTSAVQSIECIKKQIPLSKKRFTLQYQLSGAWTATSITYFKNSTANNPYSTTWWQTPTTGLWPSNNFANDWYASPALYVPIASKIKSLNIKAWGTNSAYRTFYLVKKSYNFSASYLETSSVILSSFGIPVNNYSQYGYEIFLDSDVVLNAGDEIRVYSVNSTSRWPWAITNALININFETV